MADIKVSQLPVATNVGPTDTVMIVQSGVSKQATAEKVALADNGANVRHSLAVAANDMLVASGVGAFVKKSLAEVKAILGLGDAAYKNTGTVAGTVSAGDHGHANNAAIGGPYLLPASPAMTGTPTAPTAATGTNSTQISTTAFVQATIAALVASSPAALDTLNELAVALGNDPNFATTMTNALAGKAASGHGHGNDANIGGPYAASGHTHTPAQVGTLPATTIYNADVSIPTGLWTSPVFNNKAVAVNIVPITPGVVAVSAPAASNAISWEVISDSTGSVIRVFNTTSSAAMVHLSIVTIG